MKKIVRFLAILLLGLTAALTLLSGIGTTCVALDAAQYHSMKALAEYQWLYILYMLAAIATGILGIRATIRLSKSRKNALRSSLWILVFGTALGVIHMVTSRWLRGSSMPLDFIVYFTILTLIFFIILQIPSVKDWAELEKPADTPAGTAGGMTAIVSGMLFLSVQMWAGPSHFMDGVNYADAFHLLMQISGGLLTLIGIALIARANLSPATSSSTETTISLES